MLNPPMEFTVGHVELPLECTVGHVEPPVERTVGHVEPPLEPLQDAALGLQAEPGGDGGWPGALQLHVAVRHVAQGAGHAVQRHDELGAAGLRLLAESTTRTEVSEEEVLMGITRHVCVCVCVCVYLAWTVRGTTGLMRSPVSWSCSRLRTGVSCSAARLMMKERVSKALPSKTLAPLPPVTATSSMTAAAETTAW